MKVRNKGQIGLEIEEYKSSNKIQISIPDEIWVKHHFNKSEYNLRVAQINFNLNKDKEIIKKLENTEEIDPDFNTYEWVVIMAYYAMFHSVNALLRKIGIIVGKEHSHDITLNLLLYYFYFTKIIEDSLIEIFENTGEEAKKLISSYIYAKDERVKYQYKADQATQEKNAKKILNGAVIFVNKLKEISTSLNKDLVLIRLGKRAL
ncbi:MAG: HEPN domain-containing protein [Candidatus Woesearchaeota archaeon]